MFPPSFDSATTEICQDIPALNAVASLLLYDRGASPDQALDRERQPACMTRMSPPPLRGIVTREHPCFCLPEGPPARQASNLPPAGTLRLELTLGDKMGSGAGGLVYAVVHAASLTLTGAKAPHRFPPLVVKVCYGDRGRTLLHEASAYDAMECIQGVVVPRCFGYFEVETTDRTVPILCQDVKRHLTKTPPATCEDEEEDDYLEDKPGRDFSRILCVLLLEQHGGTIDLLPEQWSGVNLEESTLWHELDEMFQHLAELGIMHCNIRYAHILQTHAQAAAPAYCALHRKVHRYAHRIIDFGHCIKMNYMADHHHWMQSEWVERVIYGMSHGVIVEPWHL